MKKPQQFASDNNSGICPEAMHYFVEANKGHDFAYGDDEWTQKAADKFRELFETDCQVFFVFNGTAANSLALSTICLSYHSIVCHELSHIETDECGAPEFFSNGAKLLLGKGDNGKLNPAEIDTIVTKRSDIHYPKPQAVSITQVTEVGTVYTINELDKIKETSVKHNLRLHMDGARFANAVVSLDVHPRELTWKRGIDVLCFGGIKNGLGFGEAIIFFNTALADEFDYRTKQAGQLASKMRFMAAPWFGILENDVWLKNARHANNCASFLESELKKIPEVQVLFPREANSVFVDLPEKTRHYLKQQGWHFYTFIGLGGARFMCSWDTKKETLLTLVEDIKHSLIRE